MAKVVIAGSSDCPHFARIELLADWLAKNLPAFKLTKVVKTPQEWPAWSQRCCKERGWRPQQSPIVWRELVNQGGKGVLIGGANEFQEFAKAYYDWESCLSSADMLSVAKDNARYKTETDDEERLLRAMSQPLQVVITGASSPIVYQLLPQLADGSVFGHRTELAFTLFDSTVASASELQGVVMECEDMAQPLVRRVSATTDFLAAIADAEVLVLLDEILLEGEVEGEGEVVGEGEGASQESSARRADWLERNAALYAGYGRHIDAACRRPELLKVAVCGRGPTNLGGRSLLSASRRLPWRNVVSLPTPLAQQATGLLAAHLGVAAADVADVVVWGDAASGHFVDVSSATVRRYAGAVTGDDSYRQAVTDTVWDTKWLLGDFPQAVLRSLRRNVAGAAANFAVCCACAVASALRLWCSCHSAPAPLCSLGVQSQGWYGVPVGMFFNFPVRFHPKGSWAVVEDIDMPEEKQQQLLEAVEAAQRDHLLVFPPAADDQQEEKGEEAEAEDTPEIDFSEGDGAPEASAAASSVEDLKLRIAGQSLTPLSASSLLQLTPQLAAELLAIVDNEEFAGRIEQLREGGDQLGTVDEGEEPPAAKSDRRSPSGDNEKQQVQEEEEEDDDDDEEEEEEDED